MTGVHLAKARKQKAWSQQKAARRLGVSQPYLSLLENGTRVVTDELAQKAAEVFGLPPSVLPMKATPDALQTTNEDILTAELAALGYPGFSYLNSPRRQKGKCRRNPVEILASALQRHELDSRITEALPWVILTFPELNWDWLISTAKLNDLQNRLAFVTNVARRLAEKRGENERVELLVRQEAVLERSRLAREDTLCHESLTNAEKAWLRDHRSPEAEHWELLTDLSPEHLNYAD